MNAAASAGHETDFFGEALLTSEAIQFTEPKRTLGSGATADVFLGSITYGKVTKAAALKVFHGTRGMDIISGSTFKQIQRELKVSKQVVILYI